MLGCRQPLRGLPIQPCTAVDWTSLPAPPHHRPHAPRQIDPLAPKPRPLDLLQLYRTLQAAERDASQAVRDSEWESREVARVRGAQEQGIALEVPYYDVARGKVRRGVDSQQGCYLIQR